MDLRIDGINSGENMPDKKKIYTILGVMALAGILLGAFFYFSKEDEGRQETKAICDFRQIGIVLLTYVSEHDGQFPPSLDVLFEEGFVSDESLKVFVSGSRFSYYPPKLPRQELADDYVIFEYRFKDSGKVMMTRNFTPSYKKQ